MAIEKAKVEFEVVDTSGSTKKLNDAARAVKASFDQAAKSASSAASQTNTLAKLKRASESSSEGVEYGRARAAVGTGASARDFANQAQGLGGLVRLYATYAANLFAAGAAFTAFKNAADTTNLVKGLDTLGAASGKSLGTLSKRLVEVTDGAVSMREAMEATAKASSAGMSSKDIERLALVAKNASLALGVGMPDALSRLSRGIVKLEPELLDELGLFTKIGPATERYALELGKSVSSLTDFERRQAFANAVLTEGEKKFGALAAAAANPYDKLLSSLKNILQTGGELINKVLVPIVSLLANSPTALTTALLGVGYVLLKQALPAIGQLRAGLKNSAEQALATAEIFKKSFGDEFQTILEKRFKIPDLEAGVKKAQADLAKINTPVKLAPSVQRLAAGEETNIAAVSKVLKNKNAIVESGMQSGKKASEAQIAAAKQEILYIEKAIELYGKKQALAEARTGTEAVADKPLGRFDPEIIALQKYEKLRNKVDQANAISNAAQVAQVAGVRASWGLLNKEIADKGITGFSKFSTLAQGGLAAVGTRIMGVIGSLGSIGQAVALAGAAFMLIDSFFSKNSKQVEKFNSGLTKAEESVANVSRTITAATSIEGFATKTIDNTIAFSNALNEVSGSLTEVIKLAREADKAASTWDNFWDAIFSGFGKDRSSKLAESVASQIQSSLRLLRREGLAEEYQSELKKILKVDSLDDFNKVSLAFKALRKDQQDAVVAIQNAGNRTLGNAGAALQSFKDKTSEALLAQKALSNTFMDTSPAFKYGESLIAISDSIGLVIAQGPARVAQALDEIATNLDKAAMFGSKFVSEFTKVSAGFKNQRDNIVANENALVTYNEQLAIAQGLASKAFKQQFTETEGAPSAVRGRSTEDIVSKKSGQISAEVASENIRIAAKALASSLERTKDQTALLKAAQKDTLDRGMAAIGRAVKDAQVAAGITLGKALTANLTGPQKLQAEAAYAKQEIQTRLASISASEAMIDTQAQLIDEMKLANALQAEANTLQKNAGKTDSSAISQTQKAGKEVALARFRVTGAEEGLTTEEVASLKQSKINAENVRKAGLRPAKIAAGAQLAAVNIGLKSELPLAQRAQEEELNKIVDKTNASLLARQDIVSGFASVTSKEIITAKQALELADKEAIQKREIGDIVENIGRAERMLAEAKNVQDKVAIDTQIQQIAHLKEVKKKTEEAQAADKSLTIAKNKQQLLTQELADIDKRYDLLSSTTALENQIATNKLDSQSQLLALEEQSNQYSQTYMITQQSIIDKEKARLEASIAQRQAENAFAQKRESAEIRINALKADGAEKNKALIDAETSELTKQENITKNTVAGLKDQYDLKSNILDKTKEINLEQERYKSLLNSANSLAENLGSVFKNLGTEMGKLVTAMANVVIQSEENNRALVANAAAQKKLNEIDDPAGLSRENQDLLNSLKEEEIRLSQKSVKTEIANAAKAAAASKSLFKEKTLAYKSFAALEKGTQIASLALELKTMAGKIATWWSAIPAKAASETALTGVEAASAAARAQLTYGQIIGQYLKSIPAPFGMIAGMAAGAYFLQLIGKSGGGGGGGAFMPNAEQRQETQGTAMSWSSEGAKVQTRRGVFGDTEAKSESIANSLEIIKDNSVDGLSYDNRMLNILTSIDNGINKTAKGLYGIQGLRSGSMFGTVPGTQSGGGLLGSGFLASKTTRNITDSGLIIEGTFSQLASDTNKAVIDFFEQVTVSKKTWYGKTKTWVEETRTEIDDATSTFFKDIFGNATELFIEVGAKAGISQSTVLSVLNNLDVGKQFASLRGLKGEEFQTELSAIIGTLLDDASSTIFTSFETYAKFGEGMLETVVRVADTNTKINQQIKNIGSNIAPMGFEITEALADLAGGLQNFLDQSNFFRENFLTEEERLLPTQRAVALEMARLGYASIDTRDEFKVLVQSLDLTTESGRSNYQALMNVAEGFDKVATAAEKSQKELKAMQTRIFELTGTPAQLLAAKRAEEMADTDPKLKPTLQYIYALEDLETAENNLLKARQTEQKSTEALVNNIKKYIDSIKKFKDSLLLNAASPLTPAQKYAESKRQFDAILATATGAATTPQEQAAKDTALSQLEGSASSFLEASKVYNASSAQYTSDFSYVQQALTDTSDSLAETLTLEEKTLDSLNTQIGLLESIDNGILSLADALLAVDTAKSNVSTAATAANILKSPLGAIISGGTIFGKQGLSTSVTDSISAISDYMVKTEAGTVENGYQYSAKGLYDVMMDWGIDSKMLADYTGYSQTSILDWFKTMDPTLPAFAAGSNYVPEDMVAQIHRGERIIPAADNAQLMQNLNNREEANRVLVTEIRNLRSEVKQLREQQAKETGNIIMANLEAQQRAAEQVEQAVITTAQQSTWTAKVRESVKLK